MRRQEGCTLPCHRRLASTSFLCLGLMMTASYSLNCSNGVARPMEEGTSLIATYKMQQKQVALKIESACASLGERLLLSPSLSLAGQS